MTATGEHKPNGKSLRVNESVSDGGDKDHVGRDSYITMLNRASRSATSLIKVVALAGALVWIVLDHAFIKDWLRSLTHAEAFGVKIDRKAIDEATSALERLVESQRASGTDREIGEAAIHRSARVAPAIVGARVLWVDDKPENNILERRILEKLKIELTVVRSTEEALRALRRSPYHLLISDVWRERDPRVKLERCKVHYFDYPDDKLRQKYEGPGGSHLKGFNDEQNRRGPAGFSLVEQLAPSQEDGQMVPRIIFYAAESAEVMRSLCGDKITNRADLLLQTVVSLLEEQRWDRLTARD